LSSQIYASAPDQGILLNTATAFLQGLYPPLEGLKPDIASQTLNNGTDVVNPLGGYQYVVLRGKDAKSPDAIWLKGDDSCPAVTEASDSFEDSPEFKARLSSTQDFYHGFYPVLETVYDYKSADNMSYAKAFDIFDLINVARVHNTTSLARNVTNDELFQLRTLADSAEFGYNFNASQPVRSTHAGTFAGGVLTQLNQTVASKGKLKLSLLAGSYDTFLGFFGLANLTSVSGDFYGLPDYASTMSFELFSEDTASFPDNPDASLRVRFLFRNSTFGSLTAFPLFASGKDSLPWPEFVSQIQKRAILSANEWCNICKSTLPFCAADSTEGVDTPASGGSISNAVAGVIGAIITLGVLAIIGVLLFVLVKRRRQPEAAPVAQTGEKTSLHSRSSGRNAV